MEALGYVFYYFLSGGCLPWQGIKVEDGRKRYVIIGRIKEQTDISELGQNFPWEFGVYLRYCKNLRFSQCPDYNYLKGLFRGCLKRHNWEEDYEFDWSRHRSKVTLYSQHCTPVVQSPEQVKVIFLLFFSLILAKKLHLFVYVLRHLSKKKSKSCWTSKSNLPNFDED